MNLSDDPLTLECKLAAQQWLQSPDLLIQDFGARLLCLLSSRSVQLGASWGLHSSYVPPRDLLPEEFKGYPWGPGILRGNFEHKTRGTGGVEADVTSLPLREFYALEDTEHVGLRLGMFWASPHFRYLPHECQSLDLHYGLRGRGAYFTSKSQASQASQAQDMEVTHLEPGKVYVHHPSDIYGFECKGEPLLNLWAERSVDVKNAPRMISEMQSVHGDAVTRALTRFSSLE
eukprot:Skav224763  [mRNA]  locus=scaffold1604:301793:302920:+ [translate_table: standard]